MSQIRFAEWIFSCIEVKSVSTGQVMYFGYNEYRNRFDWIIRDEMVLFSAVRCADSGSLNNSTNGGVL